MIRTIVLAITLWLMCRYHETHFGNGVVHRVTGPELLLRPGGHVSVAGVVKRVTAKSDGAVSIRVEAQGALITGWVPPTGAVTRPHVGESIELHGAVLAPGVLNVEGVVVLPALEGAPREALQVREAMLSDGWSRSGKSRYVSLRLTDGTLMDRVVTDPETAEQIGGAGVAVGYHNSFGQFVLERWQRG